MFVTVVFFTAALFAEAEQAEEKPAEEVKTEESVETDSELKSEKVKSEEAAEIKPEKEKPEEADEAQNGSNGNIEVEVVDETENFVFLARSLNKMTWKEAQDYCKNLDYGGDSWRLPNIDELRQLVRNCPATEPGGSCRVSDEGNCLAGNCSSPKNSCTCERKPKNRGYYSMFGDADYIGLWSSSSLSDDDKKAWGAVFYSGMIGSVSKNSKLYARCVSSFKSKKGDSGEGDRYRITTSDNDKKSQKYSDTFLGKYTDQKDAEISHCIHKGDKEDKDLRHGWVSIYYTVSETGDVTYAGVQMSTVGNLTIENCIASAIKDIKFKEMKKDTTIYATYSIKFRIVIKR